MYGKFYTLDLENVVIAQNTSTAGGSAIHLSHGYAGTVQALLNHVTIADNITPEGYGALHAVVSENVELNIFPGEKFNKTCRC